MNLLADEGVDRAIVDWLRQAGHDVVYIFELSPSSKADIVAEALRGHAEELPGAFSVVARGSVRIRPAPIPEGPSPGA